ncbi:MAG: aspartate kinase, partial [Planctomycetes bacterium]|nr:aspartate kinase [Planctomycetota bacterium]
MAIVVQKFGGTSVGDTKLIKAAAQRVIDTKLSGKDLIVVVSAMGQETDRLYDLAYEIMDDPPPRELDMLVSTGEQVSIALMSIAMHSLGHDAISFVAGQIGVRTDSYHSKAKILDIQRERVDAALREGKIVIVAGFQGVDEQSNITTLGRGGSDTSAVALAAVFGAELCEIYKDVDGVFTADPRIVPSARLLDTISYDEMLELAGMGAGVLHSRSVELAKKHGVPLRVRSSFNRQPGTLVRREDNGEAKPLTGVTFNKKEAKITLHRVPDRPGVASTILHPIAQRNINVDMIIQNPGRNGVTDVTFTVPKSDLAEALQVCGQVASEIGAEKVLSDDRVAKVSAVGGGMRHHPGVAHRMFAALALEGINIQNISTSEIRISCIVRDEDCDRSLRAVHDAFE